MNSKTPDEHVALREKPIKTRLALDALPDFSTDKHGIEFRQSFVALEADETFSLHLSILSSHAEGF